ncbi:XRE family transcriptional regulator [Paludibacterium paludis]|uniref:Peptidase S24 n=1 Tax=Paludibacterium paludis TaxID=1225769 RepID=A0A918NZ63_9NEIS|nr:XRE family transcriptional regulator [Paludibacterium paludis]GGY07155.1 peptidase S24 [Paludibacterium paludis]
MELKDILQRLMTEAGDTQNGLADATRVPQPTIFRILRGESRDPRHATLKPIADRYGITVAQLRGEEPIEHWPTAPLPVAPEAASIRPYHSLDELNPDQYVMVDRYDVHLSAGLGNIQWVINQKDPLAFRARWFQHKRITPEHCKALYVRGRSMEPKLEDWDTVLIDTTQKDIIDGEIYAVCLDDQFYIKTIQRIAGGVLLKSENPEFENIEVKGEQLDLFRVIGRKVWRGG